MSDASSRPQNGHEVLRLVSEDRRLECTQREALREAVLRRAVELPLRDQRLIVLAFTGRYTYRQIASLLGMNPGAVHRRAKALEKRLTDPLVGALLEWPLGLDPRFREVGLDFHLLGKSLRRIALDRGMSRREVEAVIGFLPEWMRAARQRLRAERDCAQRHRDVD